MAREILRSNNPALSPARFEGVAGEGTMTATGTAGRALILLLLVMGSATYTWNVLAAEPQRAMTYVWGGFIGGLVLALITIFRPRLAPWTAPLYAVVEGMFLGALSMLVNLSYAGLPVLAVALTFAIFAAMFALYALRIVTVTQKFRSILTTMVIGIMIFYALSIVMGLFGMRIPLVHEGGPIGILVSLVTTAVASLVLLLDFDNIESAVRAGAPKAMEWYGAFGLTVTLVWLYLEVLRLLSKLRD